MILYESKLIDNYQGDDIYQYTIKNETLSVSFLNYGGCITNIHLIKNPKLNYVLNYQDIKDYYTNGCYLNAIVGRTSNRIKDGKVLVNDLDLSLTLNEPTNNLHGGFKGLSKSVFNVEEISDGYQLSTILEDGLDGFPGNLEVKVGYHLIEDKLIIDYQATTDKPTLVNFTHHAYFNLNEDKHNTIINHELMIDANKIALIDDTQAFTKETAKVDGLFDFREAKLLANDLEKDYTEFRITKGFDHCYLLNNTNPLVASITNKQNSHAVEVYTNSKSLQLYTGNFLDETYLFENNTVGKQYQALCLETHAIPYDYNNLVLAPNDKYVANVIYQFK